MSITTLMSTLAVPREAGRIAAAVGGLSWIAAGAHNAVKGPTGGDYETASAYVVDLLFVAGLLALAAALALLARRIDVPRHAVRAAVAGPLLLTTGVLAGVALGEDPEWFGLVAGPALLLMLYGTTRVGIAAFRQSALPRPASVLLALTVPIAIAPGGEIGGAAVIGGLWLWLASRGEPRA